ncbi:MAG: hypothetical protein SPK52_05110, partial [Synergistales bacterium]|nr:hypothetical protein [Bacteroidales bacterium]MDY6424684.1 hypothetical protein [Bacteroidales bacterium]MDY6435577.1 hypothetical protein [Synergistales bacterium]
RLKKRHKSLQQDFERLLNSLLQNPMQGVELDGGARKVRMASHIYSPLKLRHFWGKTRLLLV